MNGIFLHFLNRELLRSVGYQIPDNYFVEEIKTLAISTSFVLYSNYANIIEGSYLNSDPIKELISNNVIQFYAEKDTFEEFWYSRDRRYSFDTARYPYLSHILHNDISLKPALVRDFSMTKKLKSRLFSLNQDRQDKIGLLKNFDEKDVFWEAVRVMVQHNGNEALTMSLVSQSVTYANNGSKTLLINNMGRLLSYIYLEEILVSLNADIAVGIHGLSFYDRLSKLFPVNDVFLLNKILRICGIDVRNYSILNIVNYLYSTNHHVYSEQITAILRTLYEQQDKNQQVHTHRNYISDILESNAIKYDVNKKDLLNLGTRLNQLVRNLSLSQGNFSDLYNYKGMSSSILIITATTTESTSLIEKAKHVLGTIKDTSIVGGYAVNYFGLINKFHIHHAQCEAGSGGPSGAQAVATSLIQALKPKYILMPGIAFGLQRDKQNIGDILVCTSIHPYEKQRIGEKKLNRGEIVPSSPTLLSIMRNISIFWSKSKMHFGVILSGEKLVDNHDFVKQLKEISPEAIGGEMEGAGIYAAAYRSNVEWIIFKSIVDWGEGKTDDYQEQSSNLSSEVLLEALVILTK